MAAITLHAACLAELNEQLAALPALGSSSELTLVLHTPGWSANQWLIRCSSQEPPDIRIQGRLQSVVPISGCTHQADLFWPQAQPTDQQLVQIRSAPGSQLEGISALDGPSIWQLLQLRRSDQARSTPEAIWPWLLVCGFQECLGVHQLEAELAFLNQPEPGQTQPRFQQLLWQHLPDLQRACPFPERTEAINSWIAQHGPRLLKLPVHGSPAQLVPQQRRVRPFLERPFGVNLMGYASAALGIGEDLRTTQRALEQAGIPVAVLDLPLTTCCASPDLFEQAASDPDALAPYAFNLLCVTAEEQARFALELGHGLFRQRYTIGYWPWELSRWPAPWQPLLPLVDELWASSLHTHQALAAAIAPRQQPALELMPLAIEPLHPLSPAEHHRWRKRFGLPAESPLVICAFDGRSSYWRKNPWGAIQAFRRACRSLPPSLQPQLVIKTMHAGMDSRQWADLQAVAAADPRLLLIDQVLSRNEVLGLYGCCDVLLSLHRAEGFGRILAECLCMGLDVIATHYGGNTDFCRGPRAHPVDYCLTPVLPGCYPHHQGQVWAEPNLSHATDQLQQVLLRRAPLGESSLLDEVQTLTSLEAAAERYGSRLHGLWNQREQLAQALRCP